MMNAASRDDTMLAMPPASGQKDFSQMRVARTITNAVNMHRGDQRP